MSIVVNTYRREHLEASRDGRDGSAALSATVNHSINTIDHLIGKYGPVLTPMQVGEVTHHHPSHIRELCARGILPGVRIGNRWAIPAAGLAELIDNGYQH